MKQASTSVRIRRHACTIVSHLCACRETSARNLALSSIQLTLVSQVIIDVPTVYTTSNATYMAFRSGGLICPAGSPAGADLMSIRCRLCPRRFTPRS